MKNKNGLLSLGWETVFAQSEKSDSAIMQVLASQLKILLFLWKEN